MKDLFVTHDRKDKVQGEWIAYMLVNANKRSRCRLPLDWP